MEYLFILVIAIAIGSDDEAGEIPTDFNDERQIEWPTDSGHKMKVQKYLRNEWGYLEASLPPLETPCSQFLLAKLEGQPSAGNKQISAKKINLGCENEK